METPSVEIPRTKRISDLERHLKTLGIIKRTLDKREVDIYSRLEFLGQLDDSACHMRMRRLLEEDLCMINRRQDVNEELTARVLFELDCLYAIENIERLPELGG